MKRLIITSLFLLVMGFAGNASAEVLYAGDVYPEDAFNMVAENKAFILDVRTPEEWNWVGHPGENKTGYGDVLNGYVLNVAYMVYHEGFSKGDVMIVNTQFVKDVTNLLGKDTLIITMCRSGGRSVAAANALAAEGFTNVYNMLTGFEGGKDYNGYRTLSGWKVDGLPYNYSGVGAYAD